jgi:hypothetical protein
MFVMVKFYVFFEVRTEFLNIIETSFGFKDLVYDPLLSRNLQRMYSKETENYLLL